MKNNHSERRDSFDWGMHYLRAFAIVCILLEHLANFTGPIKVSRAFFTGSTVFFLFISGYLCQHLASRRPVPAKTYLLRKCSNVVCPYLVWSLATILVVRLTGTVRCEVLSPEEIRWSRLPEIFLFGWAQGPYWYIPFVCVLFLVSPRLSRTSTPNLIRLSLVAFAFAICLPVRTPSHLTFDPIPLVLLYVCFAWSYLFGFLYARFKPAIDQHISGYVGISLSLGLLLGLQSLCPDWFVLGYPAFDAPEPGTRSFVLGGSLAQSLQKLFFLVPAIVLANHLSGRRIAVLDQLANHSFTLYFTHHFFIHDFARLQNRILDVLRLGMLGRIALWIALAILFVAFNLGLAITLKKLFGKHSRPFIGS